jgi:aryl-alcohol dehydrogenase-like predicted oxidoreductase
METRSLGSQGLTVSAQGLGCMGMSQSYGEADEATSLATLDRALELGVTFWDTANVYGDAGPGGFGANERLLSGVLARHRDEVTLATKMGIWGIDAGQSGGTGTGFAFRLSAAPEDVRRACEESLERLGTDHIDLYYLHRVDPETPIEETIGAMGDLVQAGKVRYVGVSEVTADQLERAHATHPVSAVQSEWSLWTRDIEAEVLPTARRLGVGLVPFSPLGRGFLTGALSGRSFEAGTDSRGRLPRFSADNLATNEAILDVVKDVAAAHDVLPGQVALAWVHAQGEDVVPIPGTKQVAYLEQNTAALDVTLTEDELARLDGLAARVAGSRY